jgi:aryl-alcohol dehydrogenase-like predicted oxidoreductase
MTFGEDWGWGTPKDESKQIFDAFAEAGGTFIDTSSNYTNGTSERYVGEFVAADRDAFIIATKYTLRRPGSDPADLNAGGNGRKNMMRTVEASLRRLNTDVIDLLYLHMWDYSTPIDEVLRGLDDLITAGKVLYAGISDTPAWIVSHAQAVAELRGWSRFVAFQGEYSLLQRGMERDVLPMTDAMGMAAAVFGLVAGGVLTGKFNRPGGPGEHTRARNVSDADLAAAAAVVDVAVALDRSPSQVAIAWARQRSPNIIPILGARRIGQLADNLGALDLTLDAEHLATLSAIRPLPPEYPGTFWNDYIRRDLIYGRRVDQLDAPNWPR